MIRLAGLLLGVVFVAGPAPSAAFELLRVNRNPCARDDENLSWPARAVAVSTARLPAALQALGMEASERWNQSVPGFHFSGTVATSCVRDGMSGMEFSARTCDGSSFGDAVAVTRSVWMQNGDFVDSDILFNEAGPAAINQDIFLEVAIHELGHVLGLDHSDSCGASGAGTVMKSFLASQRILFPQADDVSGAQSVYPGGTGGAVPEGANSCAVMPPRRSAASPLPWAAIPVLWWMSRLRRIGAVAQNAARKMPRKMPCKMP